MSRTIFIGDIHGCAEEFHELVGNLDYKPGFDKLYLTGDMFARGPKPVDVFRLVREYRAQAVMGNHDWKMLRYIERLDGGARNGEKFGESQIECVQAMEEVRPALREYLTSLPLSIIGLGWVLVHAGVHPVQGIEGTDLPTALFARTFPGPNIPGNPKWYDCYDGDTLIIFGHDAKGKLVRREKNGKPIAIGIDSGCVYGGELSAYILEDDAIVQVPAKSVYYDPVAKSGRDLP